MNEVQVNIIFTGFFANRDPLQAIAQAMVRSGPDIIEFNKQQLDKGLDSRGVSLGRYANFNYKGRYEPVDLLLHGPFREGFRLVVDKTESNIESTDYKEGFLVRRYGIDIHGVPKYLYPNIADIIREDFINLFKAQ